jgi:hypothetical protein
MRDGCSISGFLPKLKQVWTPVSFLVTHSSQGLKQLRRPTVDGLTPNIVCNQTAALTQFSKPF